MQSPTVAAAPLVGVHSVVHSTRVHLAHLVQGRVLAKLEGLEGSWVVDTGVVHKTVQVAASCLILPGAGDDVLLAVTDSGLYIHTVLRRVEENVTLQFEGNVDISTPNGGIRLSAAEDLTVRAKRGVGTFTEKLALFSPIVDATIGRVKVVAQDIQQTAERLVQRLGDVYRTVRGTDDVRAGQLRMTAEETASLHGKNAFVTSSELTKIDGDQIHLG